MTLSEELTWRGLIKDTTFQDPAWLNEPKTFYLGVDVGSADSLTIGNLAVFLMAKRLLDAGWETYLLVGGATSLVGDPGGKDSERELVSREKVEANKAAIRAQVEKLFAGNEFHMVDNYDWFKDIGYLEFLRDTGKYFSLTELLQRDFITARIGEGGTGISYAEFSYSLIQGYDFWHLYKNHDVVLQIGGSDQWGNMISGVPLIRKKEGGEGHALSMPLVVNKTTGKKFGKSEEGAVWLDPQKTSPNDFYQFWINVDDDGVGDYLKIYTELDKDEIAHVMTEFEKNKGERLAQETLAYKVTELVHGKAAADEAQRYAKNIRVNVSDGLKIVVADGDSIVDALVNGKLASSKTEARQFLASNAVYINDQQTTKTNFEAADFANGPLRLRRGKTLQNTITVELKP